MTGGRSALYLLAAVGAAGAWVAVGVFGRNVWDWAMRRINTITRGDVDA